MIISITVGWHFVVEVTDQDPSDQAFVLVERTCGDLLPGRGDSVDPFPRQVHASAEFDDQFSKVGGLAVPHDGEGFHGGCCAL